MDIKVDQTNQLIINFKKAPPFKTNTPKWKHLENAIKTFVMETEQLLGLKTIIATPSSKAKNDPKYDNRFEDFFKKLLKSRPYLSVEWPVETKKTVPASRCQGNRNPKSIKENYSWKGLKTNHRKNYIFLMMC